MGNITVAQKAEIGRKRGVTAVLMLGGSLNDGSVHDL